MVTQKMINERLFEELEKTTKTGCWEYSLETNLLVWSKQTYFIHEVEYGEKIDVEKAIDFYHPDDQEKILDAFKRCLEKGENFRIELRIITAKGKEIPVESYGKPLFDENQKIIGSFGTFKDISNDLKIRKDKRISDNQLYQFKRNLYDFSIIAETDITGKIISVNDKFCEISGYSREELIGKNHNIINSGFHSKEFFRDLWKTILNGEAWTGLICNRAKDGSIYWVESFIYPNFNIDREIESFTAIRFDVTEKINMQDMLNEEKQKASFMSQLASIGEISANIAHEIKNPLAVIQANMGILPRVLDDKEKVLKITQLIEKSSERINKIVKGLQRLSYRSKEDEFGTINFKDVFLDTLDFCSEALRFHNIIINYDHQLEDILLYGHEMKISQILLNLINNAKDAIIEAECEERWINIDIVNDKESMTISIIDSGPGISSDIQDKIMESFYTTKDQGKGTGLGLALVNSFVSEHHGKFYLDVQAKNTTFVIVLPKETFLEKMKAAN